MKSEESQQYKKNGVSVIVPCFNDGNYLLEAIGSVEESPKGSYEIIVVDDGSDDVDTLKVLDYLKENGYNVLKVSHNGQSAARNAGVRASRYPYVLFLDADNRIHPEYIPEACHILDVNNEVGAVYGDMNLFGLGSGTRCQHDFDLHESFFVNAFDVCAVIRKKLWEDCKGFDEKMDFWEDWEFFMHAKKLGWTFFHIKKVLFDYREKDISVNGRRLLKENRIRIMRYVFEKHLDFFTETIEEIMSKYGLKGKMDSLRSQLDLEKHKNDALNSAFEREKEKYNKLNGRFEDVRKKLFEIDRSLVWTTVKRWQKLIDFVAPDGSLIGRTYAKTVLLMRKIFMIKS